MNNKKSAFLVPVMTLAVCAIAMVGLGFALTTSVTSSTNDIHTLAIDLDKDEANLGPGKIGPDKDNVNKLFDLELKTDKVTDSNGNTKVTYRLYSETAYFKAFDNTVDVTEEDTVKSATLKISSDTTAIKVMTLCITNVDDSNDTQNVTLNNLTGTSIFANKVYSVTVTSCTFLINGIEVTATTSGDTEFTGERTPDISSLTNFDITFTAEVASILETE